MIVVAEIIGVLLIIGLLIYGAKKVCQRYDDVQEFEENMARDAAERHRKMDEWERSQKETIKKTDGEA